MNNNEIFENIEKHILNDEKPSVYLNKIKNEGYLDNEPFCRIKKLEEIDQSPKHHPEGNVWVHTMMVLDQGAGYRDKVNDKKVFMWGLLLHDIGKASTTKLRNGRLTSYDHDKVGEIESRRFLESFSCGEKFVEKVSKLVRYHMHLLYIMKNMPFADIEGMEKYVDINDISYVFLSDRMGRGGVIDKDKEQLYKEFELFVKRYEKNI